MSKSDWIGAGITLLMGGIGYLVGGTATAVTAIAIGGVILIVVHLQGKEQTLEPDINDGRREPATQIREVGPSLPFIFGVPVGENDSPDWMMMVKHYGPNTAFNCEIEFFDDDRKNIEYLWLTEHPNSSFLPSGGVVGLSQIQVKIPEVGPEGSPQKFKWSPLNPNSQHYTASISCRDGHFVEKWEVTRVNGILRANIKIERGAQWVAKNPTKNPIVFSCRDQEFLATALATAAPATTQKPVNPGWKPNHTFVFPVAIIDPHGHLQVAVGARQPDGSQKTDFGCWNILTKHFGDV